jgi:hypothetical protein
MEKLAEDENKADVVIKPVNRSPVKKRPGKGGGGRGFPAAKNLLKIVYFPQNVN